VSGAPEWLRTLVRGAVEGLSVLDPRQPIGPDDLVPEEAHRRVPCVARFLAGDGSTRLGLVLESSGGVPRRVLDLTARHGLGPGLLDFAAAGGFEIAEGELARYDAEEAGADQVTLEPRDLARRLLSPVDIDAAQLDAGERLVVGFGLTYRAHREETATARPIVFPKPAIPSGAYAPVRAARAAELLDYELELGCVTLRELDLRRLDRVSPAADFGYLVVNDVSARAPLLRDRRTGYARAKGRPTYLPAGPWVVPGEHFTRDLPSLRRMVLTVTEAEGSAGGGEEVPERHTLRQNARLEELTLGLREMLEMIARNRTLTMPGPDGRRWPVSVRRGGRWVLPAGSMLLTGTPGGTAIRAPDLPDRLALLLQSMRYLRWPSESYRHHLERHHRAFGFLSLGDRVSGWITGLGRQEWEVR
jgi:2-keto-4-pentenoate hydratase/2-oxohepta-3-ene-1,7-dioic acid hydratase in catechol pathway